MFFVGVNDFCTPHLQRLSVELGVCVDADFFLYFVPLVSAIDGGRFVMN